MDNTNKIKNDTELGQAVFDLILYLAEHDSNHLELESTLNDKVIKVELTYHVKNASEVEVDVSADPMEVPAENPVMEELEV